MTLIQRFPNAPQNYDAQNEAQFRNMVRQAIGDTSSPVVLQEGTGQAFGGVTNDLLAHSNGAFVPATSFAGDYTFSGNLIFSGNAQFADIDVNGGFIDNTPIGATTPASGAFTTLNATGGGSLTGTWSDLGVVTTVDINGGTLDNTPIGATTPASGDFTALSATSLSLSGFTTGSVFFQGASGFAEDNTNLFWDDTNNRLGVGTNTPISAFEVLNLVQFDTTLTTVKLGTNAGLVNTGLGGVFIGTSAGLANLAGDYSIFIGVSAGQVNTTGDNNIFIGASAGRNNVGGSHNTFIGFNAGFSNVGGVRNTFYGFSAGRGNTSGLDNVYIGYNAGRYISGGVTLNETTDDSVCIGNSSRVLADGDVNEIVIGDSTTGLGSNTVVLGNDSIVTTRLAGNVGIDIAAPLSHLDVNGSFGALLTSIDDTDSPYSAGDEFTIIADATSGAITVNLPAASGVANRIYNIKKVDASGNAVTIDGNSAETIDGGLTAVLSSQYDSLTLHCDGSNWHII